mgnify:CR=1 FL=1
MRITRRIMGRILSGLLPLLLLAGCGEDRPTVVGAVLPLSGEWSVYGEPIRKGIELAHEQIEARFEAEDYTLDLDLDVRDSESQPARARQLMEELFKSGGATVVLGGVTSAEALEMTRGGLLDRIERVLLSPSASSPSLSGTSRHFFRIFPTDLQEGTKMGSFAGLELELDQVAVLAVNNPFARGISNLFQDEFERYDGEVLGEVVYPEDTEDFGQYVDEVLALDPPAIYIADFAEPVRQILEVFLARGYRGQILTTSAFASPDVIEAAGDAAEGVILTQTLFDPDGEEPQVQAFVQAYEEKYGEMPGLFAAHGYDAMMVAAEALEESRLPSDMWQALRSLDYAGVTGQIQFDERGDIGKFPRVYQIQDGRLIDYEAISRQRMEELQRRRQQIFKDLERLRRERQGGGNP